MVRSRLETAALIWSPIHVTSEDAIENVQKRFLRYLFFKVFNVYTFYISYNELLKMFNFESLSSRRKIMELVFLFKLVRGRVDDPGSLGALCYRVPNFNSRSKLLFSLPHCRTQAHAFSPLYRVMRQYNSLLTVEGEGIDIFYNSLISYKNKCSIKLNLAEV